MGFGVTTTQLGYALGLIFLVPLGDLLAKRALAVSLLAASSVALVLAAVAWSPLVLVLALSFVGISSVAVNVLIPFAATLASDHERGRVLGTMMTGLFLGVLLARTVSGALGQVAGWRTVYVTAAVVAAVLAVVLFLALPALPVPEGSRSYARLLRSVLSLIRQERFLRRRMLVGALGFASFQLLWTALPSQPRRSATRRRPSAHSAWSVPPECCAPSRPAGYRIVATAMSRSVPSHCCSAPPGLSSPGHATSG